MNDQLIADLGRGPGSLNLSRRVLLALGWTIEELPSKGHAGGTYDRVTRPNGYILCNGEPLPDPTRNLQDAVDSVPADMFGRVTFSGPCMKLAADTCKAELWWLSNEVYLKLVEAEADTSALALCICLLRAAQIKGREK